MTNTEKLFEFINSSPSAYHTVDTVRERLSSLGYTELYENEEWRLEVGRGYYVRRGGSSIIAFRYRGTPRSFNIVAAHSDFPSFRIKRDAEARHTYVGLDVERYGGSIYYSWLDRPLGIAGRVCVMTDGGIEQRLVNLPDALVMPSVAPHLNRDINSGFAPSLTKDMQPLYALDGDGSLLMSSISASAGVALENILSYDLFLYNCERGRTAGARGELILAPRIDDLGCAFAALSAFLDAEGCDATPVYVLFNNEEVGSETKQGAASTFLYDTLVGVCESEVAYRRAIPASFMISADNAHAKHPNYPELSDARLCALLGGGVVVKYNAEERYTTDGVSDAVFRTIAARAGVKVQSYANRADMRGGSTLGSIATTRVPVSTVDIGLPQLAMHSALESAAVSDLEDMIRILGLFYSTPLRFSHGKVEL